MIAEIRGVHFENKGAELMLHAVVQKLSEWDEKNIFAMRPRVGTFKQRAEVGLYQLIWTDTVPLVNPIVNFLLHSALPKKARSLGLTTYPDVDVILDASGFAYSDQWGIERSARMAALSKRAKKQGAKVILLPQAFGPFEDPKIRNTFLQVLDNVDLVFARDSISYQYLTDLVGNSSLIKMAPDFTNLVKGRVPDYFNTTLKRACVIPNMRMIDKNPTELRDKYVHFLEACVEFLIEADLNPFILVHDLSDKELALHLKEKFGEFLEVITEYNPLNLKGILGNCYVVISSRFHGLISALSQGVPCLATGWSHKYQMLFEDYNCPECLVSPLDPKEKIQYQFRQIVEEPSRSELINQLQQASFYQKKLASDMWDEVYKVLVKDTCKDTVRATSRKETATVG